MKWIMERLLRRRAERLVRFILPELPAIGRILDVGSGTGHNADCLAGIAPLDVIEADVVDIHLVGRGPVLFDGKTLPFPDAHFSASILLFVLQYAAEPELLLSETRRVTSGRVMVLQSIYSGRIGHWVLRAWDFLTGRFALLVAGTLGLISARTCAPASGTVLHPREPRATFRQFWISRAGCSPAGCLGSSRESRVVRVGAASTMSLTVSVIIPSLNEEALILETLESVQRALGVLPSEVTAEIIVVDNGSTDNTRQLVERASALVRLLHCPSKGAARARNLGRKILTRRYSGFSGCRHDDPSPLDRSYCRPMLSKRQKRGNHKARSSRRGSSCALLVVFLEFRAAASAAARKAMPALMFCTRTTFDDLGPFNEDVAIGEEWPILARLYRSRRNEFIYLRSITARTSSRRMELIPFGYTRLFLKYVWAILHYRGRINYPNHDPALRQGAARCRDSITSGKNSPILTLGQRLFQMTSGWEKKCRRVGQDLLTCCALRHVSARCRNRVHQPGEQR